MEFFFLLLIKKFMKFIGIDGVHNSMFFLEPPSNQLKTFSFIYKYFCTKNENGITISIQLLLTVLYFSQYLPILVTHFLKKTCQPFNFSPISKRMAANCSEEQSPYRKIPKNVSNILRRGAPELSYQQFLEVS